MNNKIIGNYYEDFACKYLLENDYSILDRNWRWSNRGEIDIVAIDPNRFSQEYLIFIEVKYRSWSEQSSMQALSSSKIKQIRRLALVYLKYKKINANKTNISFDFIAIHNKHINHIKNIC